MDNSKVQTNTKHARILLTSIFTDDSEIEDVKRMYDSFLPYVDEFVAVITGLSGKHEKLKELITKRGGSYMVITPETHPEVYKTDKDGVFFANFAAARNISFEMADNIPHIDWYTWADKDDILLNGHELQKVADRALELNVDQVLFTYWYSIKINKKGEFGPHDVQIDHLRERLIKPKTFKWTSRLHEITVPIDGNYKANVTLYAFDQKLDQNCVWAHITSREKADDNMKRNLRILEHQAQEEHYKDPRTLLYIAKVYYDRDAKDDRDKAMTILIRDYLKMSGWPEERGNAWTLVGNIWSSKGDHKAALESYFSAIKEWPHHHLPYLYIAREYAEIGLLDASHFWLEVALRMEPPRTRTTIGSPWEIKITAASLKYNEAMRANQFEEALDWLRKRNKYLDIADDPMEQTLMSIIDTEKAAKNVFQYAQWLKNTKQEHYIEPLLESLPYELGNEPFAHYIANDIKKPKIWPKKSIVYYASWGATHFEKWSAKSLKEGIGGSETAVIELARQWAKKGYDVWVYGDPREDAGDYEGVHYRPWYEINWHDTFDTLILWRSPHLLDRDLKYRNLFMDLHDIASQVDWTEARMHKVTGVMFKSQYHRKMLPKLPDEKAIVISNGI